MGPTSLLSFLSPLLSLLLFSAPVVFGNGGGDGRWGRAGRPSYATSRGSAAATEKTEETDEERTTKACRRNLASVAVVQDLKTTLRTKGSAAASGGEEVWRQEKNAIASGKSVVAACPAGMVA
uniref:Uncharacterized protein n=1 Tax=Oryza meridionalis TaxID=40149 RepID=A0A0E0E0M3_9ORYZ